MTRLAVALGGAALVAAGGAAWRLLHTPPRPAGLPAAPAAAQMPAEFTARVEAAERLLRRDPPAGVAELGRLFHANGFADEAEACWRWLRAAQPGEPRWTYLLADLRRTAGDPQGHESLVRETVRLAPGYAPAWLQLAGIAFKSGRMDEAAEHYRRRLALVPGDPHARLGLARIDRQRGEDEAAGRALAALVRDAPDFPPAHNLYAEMLAAAGREAEARRHRWLGRESGRFREADDPWLQELNDWCLDPRRLAVLGTAEFQLGRGDRGRSLLERAVRLAPQDAAAHELLGELYLKLEEPARARETLARGLELAGAHGGHPPASLSIHLAESLRQLGRTEEALAVLAAAIEQAPRRPELHVTRGIVLDSAGRTEAAMSAFRDALQLNPHDPDANHNLGFLLARAGRVPETRSHLEQALFQRPTFAKPLALLGQIELAAGRLDRAGEYLQPLLESQPGIPEVQALVAEWRLQAGTAAARRHDAAEAERHFREGMEAAPDDGRLPASLGVLLFAERRFAEAVTPLEAYRRLRPGEPEAPLYLGRTHAALGRREDARRLFVEAADLARQQGNARVAAQCEAALRELAAGER